MIDLDLAIRKDNAMTLEVNKQHAEGKLVLDNRIEELLTQLENSVYPDMQTCIEMGKILFTALFPQEKNDGDRDSMRSLFHYHFKRYIEEKGNDGFRIRLRIDEENHYAQSIPWEFLYYEEYRSFLGPHERISITRMTHNLPEIAPVPIGDDLRMLIILSAQDRDLTYASHEKRAIGTLITRYKNIRPTIKILSTEKEEKDKPTCDNIITALDSDLFNIVHFIGHSDFDGAVGSIELSDDDGDPAEPLLDD